MADYDFRRSLNSMTNRSQVSRRAELRTVVDFADHNLASTKTANVMTIPAGFVKEACDIVLRTAEGGTGTIDVGVAGGDTFCDGGNVNGSTGALLARGTNYSTTVARYASDTPVTVLANNSLDAAKIEIIISGYMTDV